MTSNWSYPLFATCAVCGEVLQFDIDPNGTPGENGDWGADGDYGCTGDEDGCDAHTPVNIEWLPPTPEPAADWWGYACEWALADTHPKREWVCNTHLYSGGDCGFEGEPHPDRCPPAAGFDEHPDDEFFQGSHPAHTYPPTTESHL